MEFYRLIDGEVFQIVEKQFDENTDLIVFDESYEPVATDWYDDYLEY
jgi:hypothetical protein